MKETPSVAFSSIILKAVFCFMSSNTSRGFNNSWKENGEADRKEEAMKDMTREHH